MLCNVCEECQVIQPVLIAQESHIRMFALYKELNYLSQISEPL